MISVDYFNRTTNAYKNKSVEHNSILLVGSGDTEYKNKSIVYPSSYSSMQELYGKESDLTLAYGEAKKCGAEQVFVLNCRKFSDYIDVLSLIAQNDFAFVCVLMDFSTTFIDPTTGTSRHLPELYSNSLTTCYSTVLFTDEHASLFEDIDHFLKEMKKINISFQNKSKEKLKYGENLGFILNNLSDYNYANVVLASMIATNDLRNYPEKQLGDVVFDIVNEDLYGHEIIYHAYSSLVGSTVENLQNYSSTNAPEKMLLIPIIKNRICMALDYEQYSGKLMNKFMKIQIEGYTKTVLQSFVGVLIETYSITDIQFIKTENSGEIDVIVFMNIKPYNSIETIQMSMEV